MFALEGLLEVSRYFAILIVTVVAGRALGVVVSYEANDFPEIEDPGWVRSDFIHLADRSIEDGWLVQNTVLLPCPPACTTQDFYRYELDDLAGVDSFFLEWEVMTDTPPVFSDVAPASIVAGGNSGTSYHFTIGNDEIRFIQDTDLPLVFVDIEAGC